MPRPAAPGVGVEVAEHAVRAEDRQAGVIERDQAHERVAMGPLAADLVGVGERRLVAVVTVGDQELGVGQLGGDRLVDSGIGDPPDAMHRAVGVGDLTPGFVAEPGLDVAPRVPGVKGEDRRQVVAGGPGEPQAILLRAGLGSLVGADQAGAVLGHPHPGEEPVARTTVAIGALVVLCQRPDRGLPVGREHALHGPGLERLGGVLVGVAAGRRLRQVDLDDVQRRAGEQLGPLLGIDDVIGRGGDVRQRGDRAQLVMQRFQWPDLRHRGGTYPFDCDWRFSGGMRHFSPIRSRARTSLARRSGAPRR